MKSRTSIIVSTAALVFDCAFRGLCQDQAPDNGGSEESLVEAYAAGNGISIAIVARDWDDIPLVPFPTGLQRESDSFLPAFTLSIQFHLTMRFSEPRAVLMRKIESMGVPLLTRAVADLGSR